MWICVTTGSQISFNNTHPSAIFVNPSAKVLIHVPRDPFNNAIDKLSQILLLNAIHSQCGPKRQKRNYPTPIFSWLENFICNSNKRSISRSVREMKLVAHGVEQLSVFFYQFVRDSSQMNCCCRWTSIYMISWQKSVLLSKFVSDVVLNNVLKRLESIFVPHGHYIHNVENSQSSLMCSMEEYDFFIPMTTTENSTNQRTA